MKEYVTNNIAAIVAGGTLVMATLCIVLVLMVVYYHKNRSKRKDPGIPGPLVVVYVLIGVVMIIGLVARSIA